MVKTVERIQPTLLSLYLYILPHSVSGRTTSFFFFLRYKFQESHWGPFPCGTCVAFIHSFNQYFGCPLCVKCITLGTHELCPVPACWTLTIPGVKSLGKVGYVLLQEDYTQLCGSIKKFILWDMLVQAMFPKNLELGRAQFVYSFKYDVEI